MVNLTKRRKSDRAILLLLFLFAVSMFLLHHYVVGFSVYSDGAVYFSYIRSAVFDRDINFTNEIEHYKNTTSKLSGLPAVQEDDAIKKIVSETMKETGYYPNHHSFGNALLWTPFYLAAHILTLTLNFLGLNLAVDGYSLFYELSVGLGSIFYGFLGIFIIYKFCQKFYSKKISLISTVAVLLGTSIFWYVSVEPTWAHANSLFLISLFIYYWYTKKEKTKIDWALLGFILGIATLIRRQNMIFVILPGLNWLTDYVKVLKEKNLRNLFNRFVENIFFVTPMIPMYLLQVFIWKRMFNKWYWLMNVQTVAGFTTTNNKILLMIFSTKCGIIVMPIILISLIGLGFFTKKRKKLGTAFLTIFILQFTIMSFFVERFLSELVCHGGYIMRFFINCTPFYAIGLCEMAQRFKEKGKLKLLITILVLFVLFNFFNMARFAVS